MAKKLYLHKQPWFKDYLMDAYTNRRLTMSEIGKEVGCTAATILGNLRRFNITIRPTSEYKRGSKLTKEHIEAIKRRHTGKIVSAETRRKMSDSRKRGKFRSPNWKGGRRIGRTDNYIQIYRPDHLFANKEGYVMEHRLVMERIIGRYLTKNEVVHHKNKVRNDNAPDNLQLMTIKEHMAFHMNERWRNKNEQSLLNR